MPCGIGINTPEEIKQNLIRTCLEVCNRLKGNVSEENDNDNSVIQKNNSTEIIRADTDLRENYSPGWKFNHWELKVMVKLLLIVVVLYFIFYDIIYEIVQTYFREFL